MKTCRLILSSICLFLALIGTPAIAAEYPDRPIKLIVGFPPGGSTDVLGRVIGQALGKELGGTVIVENKGGASGTIGANIVAKSKPDGYTLLVTVEASQVRGEALNANLPYDQRKDFTYIRKLAKQRNLLLINPALPIDSLKDLIAYAKANPGKLNYGGTIGATSHIGGTIFNALNDTNITFISYPGGAQPITDLMSGVVQVGFFTESTVAGHVKAGKLKPLAITANQRSPSFPSLPTTAEAGGKPMDISPWFGIAGPAGMPADVVRKIGAALDKIESNPEFMAQLDTLGAFAVKGTTVESYTKEVDSEINFWNKWAKDNASQIPR
jgi:tripartite-type tricarboxylate transporter receptor subunit TctC